MKRIMQIGLVLLAVGAIGYRVWERHLSPKPPREVLADAGGTSSSATREKSPREKPAVDVTYFTTDVRCDSCRKIEELARATIEENFAPELGDGTIRFQVLNLDEAENRHFIDDYALSFKTVVVSGEGADGLHEWQKLDDVWSLLNDPAAFKSYLSGPIREHLNAAR